MKPEKRDYLKECNEHKVPVEDFRQQFCNRCFQPECTRSQHGKSLFEARTSDWEERLFLNVIRMDPSDPRFKTLSAKNFQSVDVGRVPEVGRSEWRDPLEFDKSQEVGQEIVSVPEPKPEQKTEEPPRSETPLPLNTPVKSGQMIGGRPPQPSSPVSDPWAAKPAAAAGDNVVKPGAKIKLGV